MNEQYTKDYEKLREVIIGANDDITQLQFGCEFEWENEEGETKTYVITFTQGVEDVVTGNVSGTIYAQVKGLPPQTPMSWETDDDEWPFFEYAKILGRPIRLVDILLAIEAHGLNHQIGYHNILFNLLVKNDSLWDLRHDSLDWHYHNKPETVQFLIDLYAKTNRLPKISNRPTVRSGNCSDSCGVEIG